MNLICINRAAREQGMWVCILTDKENTGKLPKTAKWLREYNSNTGQIGSQKLTNPSAFIKKFLVEISQRRDLVIPAVEAICGIGV